MFLLGTFFESPMIPARTKPSCLREIEEWFQKEGAYALIQSTKPQSLAPGLNDSPAGLAAWMVVDTRLSENRVFGVLEGIYSGG
jgi:hypothetical protein